MVSPTICPNVLPVNNTQYSPSITHSMCLDGKHVAGSSGAARPGVNSVGVPGNRPQKSAMTFIVYAVTVSMSQGSGARVPG